MWIRKSVCEKLAGHVAHVVELRNAYKILVGKLKRRRKCRKYRIALK
jgi:hypothetical protein